MIDSSRVKKLGELLAPVHIFCERELEHIQVSGITDDSRRVVPGTLFVAIAGMHSDGHSYIGQAVDRGCVAVLASRDYMGGCPVPLIKVENTLEALGFIAAAFYDFPCREMKMIGVTGTNGKTTTTYLLESVIRHCGGRPGVIGTINIRFKEHEFPSKMTTPAPQELQSILRSMADEGVTHVAMEVSSHALEQQRINGVLFDVALFTNLSRDHLDFHGSMENYYEQKQKLFTGYLKEGACAVIPAADPESNGGESGGWGGKLAHVLTERGVPFSTFGIKAGNICAENFTFNLQGIRADIITPEGQGLLQSRLVGRFNLKNLLGTIGCAEALGWGLDTICLGLNMADGIPGRMEKIIVGEPENAAVPIDVFVDYAHTPDALEKTLSTLRELEPRRIFLVFGCGGERDRGKRFLMGEIAAKGADIVILTTDNSRSESPAAILADIEEGVSGLMKRKFNPEKQQVSLDDRGYCVIASRDEAILKAVMWAEQGDVVLVSGKGHECYQITGSLKEFFDDRAQARKHMGKKLKQQKMGSHFKHVKKTYDGMNREIIQGMTRMASC